MFRFTRKSAPRLPKIEGGFSQFGQCPYLDRFLKEMAPLSNVKLLAFNSLLTEV